MLIINNAIFVCLQSARYSKLEKADILELTVRHLREVQRNNMTCEYLNTPVTPVITPTTLHGIRILLNRHT